MLEPKYAPEMTPQQRQAIAKAKARLRLQQGAQQPQPAPQAPGGGGFDMAPSSPAARRDMLKPVAPQPQAAAPGAQYSFTPTPEMQGSAPIRAAIQADAKVQQEAGRIPLTTDQGTTYVADPGKQMADMAVAQRAERDLQERREASRVNMGDMLVTQDERGRLQPGTDTDRDIGKGIVTSPVRVANAAIGAAESAVNLPGAAFNAMADKYYSTGNTQQSDQIRAPVLDAPSIPIPAELESMSGQLTEGLAQFLFARGAVGKMAPGGNLAANLGKDALAVGVGFDGSTGRVADMIDLNAIPEGMLRDYAAWLKTQPDDSDAMGRLKNLIEDMTFSGPLLAPQPVIRGAQAVGNALNPAAVPTNAGGAGVQGARQAQPQPAPAATQGAAQAGPQAPGGGGSPPPSGNLPAVAGAAPAPQPAQAVASLGEAEVWFNALPEKTRQAVLRMFQSSGVRNRADQFAIIADLNSLPPGRNSQNAFLISQKWGDQYPSLRENLSNMGGEFSVSNPRPNDQKFFGMGAGREDRAQAIMDTQGRAQVNSERGFLERSAETNFGAPSAQVVQNLKAELSGLSSRYNWLLDPQRKRRFGRDKLVQLSRNEKELQGFLRQPWIVENMPTAVQNRLMVDASDEIRQLGWTAEELRQMAGPNRAILAPLFEAQGPLTFSPQMWEAIVDQYPRFAAHVLQSSYAKAARDLGRGINASENVGTIGNLSRMRGIDKEGNVIPGGLLDRLEKTMPNKDFSFTGAGSYADTRTNWGDVKGAQEALKELERFKAAAQSGESVVEIIEKMDSWSPRQKEAALSQITSFVQDSMGNKVRNVTPGAVGTAAETAPNLTQLGNENFLSALRKVFGTQGDALANDIELARSSTTFNTDINRRINSRTAINQENVRNAPSAYENPAGLDSNVVDNTVKLAGAAGMGAAATGQYGAATTLALMAGVQAAWNKVKQSTRLNNTERSLLADFMFRSRQAGQDGEALLDAAAALPPPRSPNLPSRAGYAANVVTGAAAGGVAGGISGNGDPNSVILGILAGAGAGGVRAKARSNKAHSSIIKPRPMSPPGNALRGGRRPPGGAQPRQLPGQTSPANAAITSGLVSGGAAGGLTYAATGDEELAMKVGLGVGIGGGFLGNKLSKSLGGKPSPAGRGGVKPPPGASSPARQKRMLDMVASGDVGVGDVARSMPKADVLAVASEISSTGVPGGVRIKDLDEAIEIIEERAAFKSFAQDVERSDLGLAPHPELRTEMKRGAGEVVPFSAGKKVRPPPGGGKVVEAPAAPVVRPVPEREVAVDGTKYVVEFSPIGVRTEVNFRDATVPSGSAAFKETGGKTAEHARKVLRAVEQAVRDDIAAGGRRAYQFTGNTPQQTRIYEALAQRIEPPSGYRVERNKEGFALVRGDAPPKPPPVSNGVGGSKPLPVDEGSRMQRAREMGFDVDTPLYHGTRAEFDQFDPSAPTTRPGEAHLPVKANRMGPGVYFHDKPDMAKRWGSADRDGRDLTGARLITVYLRKGRWLEISGGDGYDAALSQWLKSQPTKIQKAQRAAQKEAFASALRREGYIGIKANYGGVQEIVVFDPSNIRRTDATFDPSQEGSSKLLAGMKGAAPEMLAGAGSATLAYNRDPDTNGDGVVSKQESLEHSGAIGGSFLGGVLGTKGARYLVGKARGPRGVKPPPGKPRFKPPAQTTFAGVNAKTADRVALARAEQMAKEGASRDEIWDATGWFKGVDGKWRFEIDDSGAKLNPILQRGEVDSWSRADGINLGEVMPHPALYEAYPELAKVPTRGRVQTPLSSMIDNIRDPKAAQQVGAIRGGYGPDGVYLNAPIEDIRSTALHEGAGHGVQDIEGFARGGSSKNPMAVIPPDIKVLEQAHMIQYLAKNMGGIDEYFRQFPDALPDGTVYETAAVYLARNPERLAQADDTLRLSQNPYEAYRRLAGEAEARNVQTRDAMRMRGEKPGRPWDTQDVPDDQQIVRFGGGKAESRPKPPPSQMGFTGGKGTKPPPPPPGAPGKSTPIKNAAGRAVVGGALGAMVGGDAQSQTPTAAEMADVQSQMAKLQKTIDGLQSTLDIYDNGTPAQIQEAVSRGGEYTKPDGVMGPDTVARVKADRTRIAGEMRAALAELDKGRARIKTLEEQEAFEKTRPNTAQQAWRQAAPWIGAGIGILFGGKSRGGAVEKAYLESLEDVVKANKLLTPGPIKKPRTVAERDALKEQPARVNQFWREGGAGDNVPFDTNQKGDWVGRPKAKVATPSSLYPQKTSGLRGSDYAFIATALGEAGLATVGADMAHKEIAAAQAALDLEKSKENYERLERAHDLLGLAEAAQRFGLAFAGYRAVGAWKKPYKAELPDIKAAEAERVKILEYLQRLKK